ncbi:MAG: SMC family ATPase [Methanobrevibacter sp.]|uniref:AAA family ATPase n=1 Tax=Methanobrevibacter sp. TaxID=66852 RepID=UPI001B234D63|nr:SMC family ATPase [Methanobrevibacter sp.]MBO5151608.1 SMC family ATPase [Methanobrevibacter sp.]
MIFKRLKLRNFKSYGTEIINFDNGITVIVGENGAGKSSIFEGISFALFKQHTAGKLGDLVRNNMDSMTVELDFISQGKEYRIMRDKNKSKSTSRLLTKTSSEGDFMSLCSGDKEVSAYIKEILDMDADLFLNAIYVRQGEIAELVDKQPADKKKLIGKLLGLDSLETAWKNLAPMISEYENKLSEIKGKLYSKDALQEEFDEKTEELNNLRSRGLELESQIEEVKKLIEEISESKRNMEREKEIYETQMNNLTNEKQTLEKLENDKRVLQENLDKIREAEEEISRLEKYVSKLDVYLDFEKSVVSIQNLKESEIELEDKIDSIKEQKKLLHAKKQGYNDYLASDEKISKLDNQKVEFEKQLAALTQLEKDKKDLLKRIESDRNDIEKFFSLSKEKLLDFGISQEDLVEVDDLKKLGNTTNEFLDKISTKIEDLTKDINSKNEAIVAFKQAITSCEKPLEELANVDNKCPVCQSDIDAAKKEELINQYNTEIEENTKAISENEETIRLFEKNKESFQEKEAKVKKLSEEILEYKYKFSNLEKDIQRLSEIDEGLDSKEYIGNKLGEIIIEISKEKENRELYKQDHDDYNQSKGALDVLGSQTESEYKLKQVKNEIDTHVKNIKLAIDNDPHLSGDMDNLELKQRIDDLKEKNEQYNQLKGFVQNKATVSSQFDSVKEDIGVSNNQLEIIQNKIDASTYDKEKYEQIIYRDEMYSRRHESFSNELSEIKGRARELINVHNSLSEKIKNNEKFQMEYDNISKYLVLLRNIRELYSKNGIQKELRNNSRPIIQKNTKEFFDDFNFNYSDLILDEDYNVTVRGPEGESSMSMVSGGEKIAIALALRLGITKSMAKGDLETILLDEPTIHLDDARRQELINLLKEMSLLPQMIIVTHENQLESAADHLIKVEKENGISRIVS